MANVCCATDSVEYPATFLHAIPRLSRYFLSRLLVPVAVTHTSFKCDAFPIVDALTGTLLMISTSASTVRFNASSGVENAYFITSPSFSKPERSISSPIVFASKNTIFISSLLVQNYHNFTLFFQCLKEKFKNSLNLQKNQKALKNDVKYAQSLENTWV